MAGCTATAFGVGGSLCNSSDMRLRSASSAQDRGPSTDGSPCPFRSHLPVDRFLGLPKLLLKALAFYIRRGCKALPFFVVRAHVLRKKSVAADAARMKRIVSFADHLRLLSRMIKARVRGGQLRCACS